MTIAKISMDRKNLSVGKKNYIADFPELIDLVSNDSSIKFLTTEGIKDQVIIKEKTFYPPPLEALDWVLPAYSKVLEETGKHDPSDPSDAETRGTPCRYCQSLYAEIIKYFQRFCEPPTPYHYHFLALYAFHTYLIERFTHSPILFLMGAKTRGKTPTLEAMTYIARRGSAQLSFREADFLRLANDSRASVFFTELRNFRKTLEKGDNFDLLYARAKRGVNTSRVHDPGKGAFKERTIYKNLFGPTGATSNYMIDDITEARCVVFPMPFSDKVFEKPLIDFGLPLREKLTAFRAAHLHKPFKKIKSKRAGKTEDYLKEFYEMVITHFPNQEENFNIFRSQIDQEKSEEAENSLEVKILRAIENCESVVQNAFLSTNTITQQLNIGLKEQFQFTPDFIGRQLKAMGFSKKSTGKEKGIVYNTLFLEKLFKYYGIEKNIETLNVQEVEDIFPPIGGGIV